MAKTIPVGNPLGYLGIKESNPPEIHKVDRAPTATDYRYDICDIWLDVTNNDIYMLTKREGSTATWVQIADVTGLLHTLIGDAGSATPTVGGEISLLGSSNIATTAAGNAVNFDLTDDVTIADVNIATTAVKHATAQTSPISFNGMRCIHGDVNLANNTDFSIDNGPIQGNAILMIYGFNDNDVPVGTYNMSKRQFASNVVATCSLAGNAGAVFTVTWPLVGTLKPTFRHNCGVNKTITYTLLY